MKWSGVLLLACLPLAAAGVFLPGLAFAALVLWAAAGFVKARGA